MRFAVAIVVLVLVAGAGLTLFPHPRPAADLLLLSAHVVTMDASKSEAQAVAVLGDRILWVGSDAEARKRFGNASTTIDLHGATMLPGLPLQSLHDL